MISLYRECRKVNSAMKEAISNQRSAVSENQEQNQQEQQRQKQRAEALLAKIGEACDELERLAEENPELIGSVTRGAEEHKDAYLRLKARLQLAEQAPRCRWVKQDGTACRSPQMKKHIYCFAHAQMMEARALALSLPAQEDANAIQIGIMRIQKALIEDTISTKKAGLLLYSMQLALQNVGQVTFGQAKTEELVTETVREDAAFSDQRSAFSENQDSPRRRGDAEEIGASERQHHSQRPVEYKLPMDLYRMDTREGMEAYEAEFRKRRKDWLDREFELAQKEMAGTPPRAAAPHLHGIAESHAKLG
jgi:hypothetical protein